MSVFTEKCHFLVGPTACGKTARSLEVARTLDAEILSLDSVAIYCGMDIGSAKPGREERAAVRHHLLDLVTPDRDFSVAQYVAAAETAVHDVLSRGKTPLFVGGSPLYWKALVFGLFPGPPADEAFRESLRREAREAAALGNLHFLHDRLRAVDPITAQRLHPHDAKRLIRALEVFHLTGQPIHALQNQFQQTIPTQVQCRTEVVDIPRTVLHDRINARVGKMFEAGLLDEVRTLRERYGTLSATASMAVGYREVWAYWEARDRGETPSLPDLRDEIRAHTRQLAKRQCTWFRALMGSGC